MNFYRDASKILDQLELKKGTIKGLCLRDEVRDKKKMYAIICETLKYKKIIQQLLTQIKYSQKEKKNSISKNMTLVLVHDLLFSKGGIQAPSGPIKDNMLLYKAALKDALAKLRLKKGAKSNKDLIKDLEPYDKIPRYVRVNTIKISTLKVIKTFIESGFKFLSFEMIDWSKKKENVFCLDPHIKDLLCLPSGIDLHDHKLLKDGSIILQDKASCLPAFILNPPSNSFVIDACAAPGNKTSHLAMIMKNQGRILALDLDAKRLDTLKKLTGRAGCKIIEPLNQSFLLLDPLDEEYKNVEYILLDPSCSGSGIVSRLDYLVDENETKDSESDKKERLLSLAQFQKDVIEHAFKFPNVKEVVYSTCSIHKEENEEVVKAILNGHDKQWELASTIPAWGNRGITINGLDNKNSKKLIRCDPQKDLTNGFFVALFRKIGSPIRPPIKIEEINMKQIETFKELKNNHEVPENLIKTKEEVKKENKANQQNQMKRQLQDDNKKAKKKHITKKNKIFFSVTKM